MSIHNEYFCGKIRKIIFWAQLFKVSLWIISLTILADSIYNILIFFAEKKCEKLLTFFQQKISAYLRIT